MCISFIPNFPSFKSADVLLKNKDYSEVANLLAIAPDNITNIRQYHKLATALLAANTNNQRIERIALQNLEFCAKNGYLPSQQRLVTFQSKINNR